MPSDRERRIEEAARALDNSVTRLSHAITFAPHDVDDARTEAYRAQDALRTALAAPRGEVRVCSRCLKPESDPIHGPVEKCDECRVYKSEQAAHHTFRLTPGGAS